MNPLHLWHLAMAYAELGQLDDAWRCIDDAIDFDNKAQRWSAIELLHCTPISDEALTYAMSLRLKRWNADYISLRADPVQPWSSSRAGQLCGSVRLV
jgi:hypothetical protein